MGSKLIDVATVSERAWETLEKDRDNGDQGQAYCTLHGESNILT